MTQQLRLKLPDTPLSKEEMRLAMFERVPAIINALADIIQNEDNPSAVRLSAINSWLDRAMGKPRQEIEQVGDNKPMEILIRHFTDGDDNDKNHTPQ
jgi:hypothetical protein